MWIPWTCLMVVVAMCISLGHSEIPSLPRCPLDLEALRPCVCGNPLVRGLRITCTALNLPQLAKRFQLLQGAQIATLEVRGGVLPLWDEHLVGNVTLLEVTLRDSRLQRVGANILEASAPLISRFALPNNALQQVPGAIQNFTALRVLDLSYNQIAVVSADGFRSLPWLQELDLAGNLLLGVNASAFASLASLSQLSLAFNRLQEMPDLGFPYDHSLQVLNVSGNNISSVPSRHLQNLTRLYTLDLGFNQIAAVESGMFRANSRVVYLFMDHNQLSSLPDGLFPWGMALQNLTLSYNRIASISPDLLGGLGRLLDLQLSYNALTAVPSKLVSGLSALHIASLNFSHNPIASVGAKAVDGVFNLTTIDLSFGNLTTLDSGALGDLQGVTRLLLNNNQLQKVKADALGFLPAVGQLDLSYNNITKLKLMEIGGLIGLRTLNLSHNGIRSLSGADMPKLPSLLILDISHNGLQELAAGCFKDYLSLWELYLNDNLLRTVDSSTFGSGNILQIDISNNNITNLQRFAFNKLKALRSVRVDNNFISELFQAPNTLAVISARNNSITTIKGSSFPPINTIGALDVSWNQLTEIEAGAFKHLGSVTTINLRGNHLSSVPKQELQNHASLSSLDLGQNNISTVDRDAFAGLQLQTLYLDGNQIVKFNETALNGLPRLGELKLNNNRIPVLDSALLRGLSSAFLVDLSGNAFTDVPVDAFSDLWSVRSIGLANNQLGTLPRRLFDRNAFLEAVDLSGNRLQVLPKYLDESVNRLTLLNLSRNHLQEVLGTPTFRTLTTLDLSRNAFTQLSVQAISKMPRLQRLLLNDNPLELLSDAGLNSDLRLVNLDNTLLHSVPFSLLLSMDQDNASLSFRNVSIACDCRAVGLQEFLKRAALSNGSSVPQCAGPAALRGRPIADAALGAECEASRAAIFKLLEEKVVLEVRAVRAGRTVVLSWDTLLPVEIASFGLNVEYANRSVHSPRARLPYYTNSYAVPDLSFSTTYKACVQSFDSLAHPVGSPACKLVQLASLDTAANHAATASPAQMLTLIGVIFVLCDLFN